MKRFLLALLATLTVITLASCGDVSHPKATAPAPVVLVHGYSPNGTCPGIDVASSWGSVSASLKAAGFTSVTPVAYYQCDGNGTRIGSFTRNTDIRQIGIALAWWVYNTYTAKGQAVDLVGHSMGGLIIRTALSGVSAHDVAFPATLKVANAVTISTPFLGAGTAANNASVCSGALQCAEFAIGSTFLAGLDSNPNPQGTGGTDWTVMGGGPCDVVTTNSATALNGHRVYWTTPCYTHGGYLTDRSQVSDTTGYYQNPGMNTPTLVRNGLHSIAFLLLALHSTSW
jgi:pimeloyl-ACP methyl ester carboxylesterase